MSKEKGVCSICLGYDILSDDHIPPKCCGNKKDTYYTRFTREYLEEPSKRLPIHSQNGVKVRSICNKCNNNLGTIYDVELEKFYKSSMAQLNGNGFFEPFDISKVIKAIIGHLLAASKPQLIEQDNDMRMFYKSNDFHEMCEFAKKYSLFCCGYPYKESIFILRNFVSVNFDNKTQKQIPGLLSSLYFYPFAFIFARKSPELHGVDLLDFLLSDDRKTLSIPLDDWCNTDGAQLSQTWPAIVDDSHALITTPAAEDSVFKPK